MLNKIKKMFYKMCPQCGKKINGGNRKLEKHLYGEGEPKCKWSLPIVGYSEKKKTFFGRGVFRKSYPVSERKIPSSESVQKPEPIVQEAKPKGKVLKTKAEIDEAIKEIENGE